MFKKFLVYHFPAIIFAGMIFLGSSVPGENLPEGFWRFDKLAHLGEYVILGFLLARAFHSCGNNIIKKYFIIITVAIGVFYGLTDEYHQAFVLNRKADIMDYFIDTVGVIMGTIIFIKFIKYVKNKKIS